MCGVVGLIGTSDSAREAFLSLTTLQHRGQDAAGILTHDPEGFHRVRNLGLVEAAFQREHMDVLTGTIAIGHTRYSTAGSGDIAEIQPLLTSYPYGIGLVHNGNIVNAARLAQELRTLEKRHLLTHSDSEVILNVFASELAKATDRGERELDFAAVCTAVKGVHRRLVGSYSVILLIADYGLVAFRDPQGIRPLIWGRRPDGAVMFASESTPLAMMGYLEPKDVAPGGVVAVDLQGKVFQEQLCNVPARHCMFEWVYFASPESVIDQVPVYGARIELGRTLAHKVRSVLAARGFEADVIVPVPETSRIAAIALSEELGIPYRELLIKNRYIKRTFILDSQEKRQKAVNLKLSPVRSEVQGKRVVLIDDSIVRGTTSKKIVELVRSAGAKQVFLVSTCPPIQTPCYYGIDFPDPAELIAGTRTHEEIEKELGADAVIYQDLEGLQAAVGGGGTPCMACLDGKYPTDLSDAKRFQALRSAQRSVSK